MILTRLNVSKFVLDVIVKHGSRQ